MNAEQKQQAKQLIADWTNVSRTSTPAVWFLNADCMAGFLQELVDALEPEPVARVTGYYAGYLSIATVDGRVLPAGTALYTAPPAPSVKNRWLSLTDVEWMNIVNFDRAYSSYDKEEAVNESVKRTEAKLKELNAAPTPAEAPADVARDAGRYRWLRRENAKPGLGFYVGDDTDTMPGDITWIGSDLDAAIDAAIAAEKGGA